MEALDINKKKIAVNDLVDWCGKTYVVAEITSVISKDKNSPWIKLRYRDGNFMERVACECRWVGNGPKMFNDTSSNQGAGDQDYWMQTGACPRCRDGSQPPIVRGRFVCKCGWTK